MLLSPPACWPCGACAAVAAVATPRTGGSGMPVDGSLMACSQHTFRAGELEEGPEESELQDADRPLGEIILGPGPLKDRVLLMA
mmetsp:Transcript_15860/g.50548  ORF Transcript_15860/g.50548 Transcript_15860/m.50548 type:complete len:84 (+) Transcript_15860:981-1232(+)